MTDATPVTCHVSIIIGFSSECLSKICFFGTPELHKNYHVRFYADAFEKDPASKVPWWSAVRCSLGHGMSKRVTVRDVSTRKVLLHLEIDPADTESRWRPTCQGFLFGCKNVVARWHQKWYIYRWISMDIITYWYLICRWPCYDHVSTVLWQHIVGLIHVLRKFMVSSILRRCAKLQRNRHWRPERVWIRGQRLLHRLIFCFTCALQTPRLPALDPAYLLTCSNPCVGLAFFLLCKA